LFSPAKARGRRAKVLKGVAYRPMQGAVLAVTLGRTGAECCNRPPPRPNLPSRDSGPGRPTHWTGWGIAVNDNSIRMLTMFVSAVFTLAPFHAARRMAMIDGAPGTAYVSRHPGAP
jgi:hypothetical protein